MAGYRLRAARRLSVRLQAVPKDAGLTQSDVALRLGVIQRTYSTLERDAETVGLGRHRWQYARQTRCLERAKAAAAGSIQTPHRHSKHSASRVGAHLLRLRQTRSQLVELEDLSGAVDRALQPAFLRRALARPRRVLRHGPGTSAGLRASKPGAQQFEHGALGHRHEDVGTLPWQGARGPGPGEALRRTGGCVA